MKISFLLIALALALSITSCAAIKGGYVSHKLVYVQPEERSESTIDGEVEHCSNLYAGGGFAILEVFCSSGRDGLYIYGDEYQERFDWHDKRFGVWATTEGCNIESDCYYEVKVDGFGMVKELKYFFFINQSEGFYRVKVGTEKLEVLEKKITDYP